MVSPEKMKDSDLSFEDLGLSPNLSKVLVESKNLYPSKFLCKLIRRNLSGADLVVLNGYGSGVTAGCLVPILHRLKQHGPNGVRALVLLPNTFWSFAQFLYAILFNTLSDFSLGCLCAEDGDDNIMLRDNAVTFDDPDVLMATPELLLLHLSEANHVELRTVEYVVLDWRDDVFDVDLAEQLNHILGLVSEKRQTLLFSKVLTDGVRFLVKAAHLRAPKFMWPPVTEASLVALQDKKKEMKKKRGMKRKRRTSKSKVESPPQEQEQDVLSLYIFECKRAKLEKDDSVADIANEEVVGQQSLKG